MGVLLLIGVSGDGAVPCAKLGTCGGNWNVYSTDPRIWFEGYARLDMQRDNAVVDRAPFGNEGSLTRMSSPGTRVSFVTDAHRVQAFVEYKGAKPCHPACPIMGDGKTCYRPNGP